MTLKLWPPSNQEYKNDVYYAIQPPHYDTWIAAKRQQAEDKWNRISDSELDGDKRRNEIDATEKTLYHNSNLIINY